MEYEGDHPVSSTEAKVVGIDLGIKDFAITYDGEKTSKYPNPKHLTKYEKKLAKKQRIAARKVKGSSRRRKATLIVARVYEQVSNVRQDYLHKLSRKIVDNNQVVVVENLNVKGMVRNPHGEDLRSRSANATCYNGGHMRPHGGASRVGGSPDL